MPRYEYKAVPAPRKGAKGKGVKTPEDRFALAMTNVMNQMGGDGWEYIRSDTLTVEEKSAWARKSTLVEHAVLVFRRELSEAPRRNALIDAARGPRLVAEPEPEPLRAEPPPEPRIHREPEPAPVHREPPPPEPMFRREPELRRPSVPTDPEAYTPDPDREVTAVPLRRDRPEPPPPQHPRRSWPND